MFSFIYKKLVLYFQNLLYSSWSYSFSVFQSKNFNLDASSDALLEGDKDLKYLEVNERYGSKDFSSSYTYFKFCG